MIKLKNLNIIALDAPLLRGVNLEVKPGEIHAVLGPKFSGKSALAHAIMGHPGLEIESGGIYFNGKKINGLSVSERTSKKIFVSFQHPPEFTDLTNWEIAAHILNNNNLCPNDFLSKYIEYSKILGLGEIHGERYNNLNNLSTFQLKVNELLFMLLADPDFIIIDEIDEQLSDKEIEKIGVFLQKYIQENNKTCIIISKKPDILEFITPSHIHVMSEGEIKISGGAFLFKRINEDGFSGFLTSTKR